ncbi:OsmC family protein [Terrimonas alba]|uniref:OsmC family protein n=1 Tax=Terrimonas alba TaxID=3349636 RepID=UPI0035F329D1
MQTTINAMNGVNLGRLSATIAAIRAQPDLAKFNFRLSNNWVDGGHNRSIIREFYGAGQEDTTRRQTFVYDNDEPEVLLGMDQAPNPAEFVLHALAGCLTTSLVYHAAARGYEIKKASCELEGDFDLRGFLGIEPFVRNGYKEIRVKFLIEGNFSEDQKEEILKLGPAFSPVFDIIKNAVPVKVSLDAGASKAEAA